MFSFFGRLINTLVLLCCRFDATPTIEKNEWNCTVEMNIRGRKVKIEKSESNGPSYSAPGCDTSFLHYLFPMFVVYVDGTKTFDSTDYGIIYWAWVRAARAATQLQHQNYYEDAVTFIEALQANACAVVRGTVVTHTDRSVPTLPGTMQFCAVMRAMTPTGTLTFQKLVAEASTLDYTGQGQKAEAQTVLAVEALLRRIRDAVPGTETRLVCGIEEKELTPTQLSQIHANAEKFGIQATA